jgi:hypothetical protein
MAETLGSLIDKLTIKNLRLWHIDEALETAGGSKTAEPRAKKRLVERQRRELVEEIDGFLTLALRGKVKIRDQKVKLYSNPEAAALTELKGIAEAVSELAVRNIRLWHLEDEVRKPGVSASKVATLKRQIDTANQERNNLMDRIDEILETKIKKPTKTKKRG